MEDLDKNSVVIIVYRASGDEYCKGCLMDSWNSFYEHRVFHEDTEKQTLEFVKHVFDSLGRDTPSPDFLRISNNLSEENPEDLVKMYDDLFKAHEEEKEQKKLTKLNKEKEENELWERKVYAQLKEKFAPPFDADSAAIRVAKLIQNESLKETFGNGQSY